MEVYKMKKIIFILIAVSLILILFLSGCKKTGKATMACPMDMPYCPEDCQRDPDVDCTGQGRRIPPDCEPDCKPPRVNPVPWPNPPDDIYNGESREYPICYLMIIAKKCSDGSYAKLCNPPKSCDDWCCPPPGRPQPPPPKKIPYPWPYPEIGIIWLNNPGYECVKEEEPDASPSPGQSPEKVWKFYGGDLCVKPSPPPT